MLPSDHKIVTRITLVMILISLLTSCQKESLKREAKVLTDGISEILATTTNVTGNIIDLGVGISDFGHCWSLTENPTIEDSITSLGSESKIGIYTSNLNNLQSRKVYFVRAYIKSKDQILYGDDIQFTTLGTPLLTSLSAISITSVTAIPGGFISSDGGSPITDKGILWRISSDTAWTKLQLPPGTGPFSTLLDGLTPSTEYFFRAYATNAVTTTLGAILSFTTDIALPSITTTYISSITGSTAIAGGNVTASGAALVSVRGVCWSLTPNPTLTDSKTSNGSGLGGFTSSITGLSPGRTYHVRTYATNSYGTSYGNDIWFISSTVPPTLTTSSATLITSSSAVGGGIITSDGGGNISSSGICWSTSQNPTIINNKTIDVPVAGTFASSMASLTPNTIYFVRAYATNTAGTAYGTQISFTTLATPTIPTLTTNLITNINPTFATGGGNVSNSGGSTITERGICFDTNQNPTTASTKVVTTGTTGTFTAGLTGLNAGTLYYVRAFAINSTGTGYGSEVSFTTTPSLITVSDIDGNNYNTVVIGTQVWMSENLKTTKYRDGTNIPNVTDNTLWATQTTGAYSWYSNEIANKGTYGALYNYYTTIDSRNICPTGWHVPTKEEWTTLINYSGGTDFGGAKLKEAGFAHWLSPNTGATNEFGFTALPGGGRNIGNFVNLGEYGFWWSSTLAPTSGFAMCSDLLYNNIIAPMAEGSKSQGFSVRCLKD